MLEHTIAKQEQNKSNQLAKSPHKDGPYTTAKAVSSQDFKVGSFNTRDPRIRDDTHPAHDQSYPPSNLRSQTHPTHDHVHHPPKMNDPTYHPSSVHPHHPSKLRWSNTKEDEMLQGFQNVQQVLLQNSNLIQDIDHFLEKSNSS